MIVELLAKEGSLGKAALAEALDLRPSRTKELLSGMVAKGMIVSEGASRARVYRLPSGSTEQNVRKRV